MAYLPDNKHSRNWQKRQTTKEQKLLRMDIIAPLFKRGWSYREIREEVMKRLGLATYSLRTVKLDVDALLKEWRETRIADMDLSVQLELQRIDDLIKEAWEAWEKSKEDYEKQRGSQDAVPVPSDGEGGNVEESILVTHLKQSRENIRSCGDPRYLELINKLLIERRKLLGLYAPEKKDVVEVKKEIVGNMTDEELENEIKKLRALNAT